VTKPYPQGCGKKLAPSQFWTYCGETDIGNTAPALCENCWKPEFREIQREPFKLDKAAPNTGPARSP
jgi:hypothetical protein